MRGWLIVVAALALAGLAWWFGIWPLGAPSPSRAPAPPPLEKSVPAPPRPAAPAPAASGPPPLPQGRDLGPPRTGEPPPVRPSR